MKSVTLFLLLILTTSQGLSSELSQAPIFQNTGHVAIDIIETQAQMTISANMSSVEVTATTTFVTNKKGKPILFLRMALQEAKLNNEKVKINGISLFQEENSPSLIDKEIDPGTHTLTLKGSFRRSPFFNQLVTIDYIKGDFTERALPANFMYDFYKLSIDFKLESPEPFELMSNGIVSVEESNFNQFHLEFPPSFNSSYFFMDFTPKKQKLIDPYKLTSIDGREVPVNIYLQTPNLIDLGLKFKTEINNAFAFLESHLGPYPYKSIEFKVINNNRGGAFAGALILDRQYSSDGWIVHELGHSWFLKGVSPVNGYDGWMYEGFAEWARFGFPRAEKALNPIYKGSIRFRPDSPMQKFPDESWDKGRIVLSHLDKFLEKKGGLVPLMKKLHEENKGHAVSTEDFFKFLRNETGLNFTDFRKLYFR